MQTNCHVYYIHQGSFVNRSSDGCTSSAAATAATGKQRRRHQQLTYESYLPDPVPSTQVTDDDKTWSRTSSCCCCCCCSAGRNAKPLILSRPLNRSAPSPALGQSISISNLSRSCVHCSATVAAAATAVASSGTSSRQSTALSLLPQHRLLAPRHTLRSVSDCLSDCFARRRNAVSIYFTSTFTVYTRRYDLIVGYSAVCVRRVAVSASLLADAELE